METQSLAAGSQFGPYSIEGFIAGGGMGEVYAARDAVYGSAVALKVLHPHLHREESWRKRFNEEGLVGTQLKHPNILSARELVEHDGRIALVMDLVSGGQTLLRVMDREFSTGLPLTVGLKVFLSILQGIEYLHGKEIIHGDIKPENVMIQGNFREPTSWVPVVTDFGTVALIADPVTIAGQAAVVATPRYASPEHMRGIDQVDGHSDVYCLGLLLHYMLCCRHASSATDVQRAAEVVQEPISMVHLVDLPESVRALVVKSTAVAPEERYPSVRELALAVRDVLDALGEKLELADLSADLATEIVEEQAEAQRVLSDSQRAEAGATELELDSLVDEPIIEELSDESFEEFSKEPNSDAAADSGVSEAVESEAVAEEAAGDEPPSAAEPAPSSDAPEPASAPSGERVPESLATTPSAGRMIFIAALALGALVVLIGFGWLVLTLLS